MPRKWKAPFLNFLVLVTIVAVELKAESELIDTIVCSPSQYKCNSGECIANNYKCNGLIDCHSREDEYDCGMSEILYIFFKFLRNPLHF